MFIVRLDGEVVTVTNTFDSAAWYADGIRGVGHRVAITLASPDELPPALRALEQRTSPGWSLAAGAAVTV
ncbi:MAG: hypothetical protein ACOYXU_08465 [Nitrospirota bacterium]